MGLDVPAAMATIKQEFAPDFEDQGFSLRLTEEVIDNHSIIDKLITKFAPEWPLDQITLVDRNVLRIGIYELKFDKTIPPKVAINEAIELAKTYGGASSGKFVNGVLGSIYKEMIQRGEKQTLESQGIKEESSGGVIYRRSGKAIKFALILDSYGKWTFPKGHVDEKEKPEEAAERDIAENLLYKNLSSAEGTVIEMTGKANKEGSLFASIHKEAIAAELRKQKHIDLSAECLEIEKPIKEVGTHRILVSARGKKGSFTLLVKEAQGS